jgi:hypothetical protein
MLKLEAQREQEELRRAHELVLIEKQIELARLQASITTHNS